MRIIDTGRFPVDPIGPNSGGLPPWGPGAIVVLGGVIDPLTNYKQGSSLFLPPVRLGRVWNIDRFVIRNPTIYNFLATAVNQIAFTFNVQLNGVSVGDDQNLVYDIAVNNPASLIDITSQNGPVTVTPYNALEVRSGDQLKLTLNWALAVAGVQSYEILVHTTCQIIGENSPDALARR